MFKLNSVKAVYSFFVLTIASIVLHNLISARSGVEEAVFFILALLFLAGFVVSIFYSAISYSRKREPKDLWKLGFLGLFGLVGLVASPGLFGFFGFFGFFGARNSGKG